MIDLLYTIGLIFGMIAIGYLCGLFKILPVETGDQLSKFVFTIAVPILLFRTMISADFGGSAPWSLWGAYFAGVASTWALGSFLVRRIFNRDARAGVVAGLASSFSNLVLLGIPLILGVFGPEGFEVLSLIISVHLLIMMLSSVILFEWAVRADGVQEGAVDLRSVAKRFAKNLFSNPIIVGVVAGWSWRLTGVPLPGFVDDLSMRLADVAGPVALFAMGLALIKFGFKGNAQQALATTFSKLVFMPAVVLSCGLLLGLPPFILQVAVASAALPTGANPYLIANHFGTGQGLASNALTIATALSSGSVLCWLLITQWVSGL